MLGYYYYCLDIYTNKKQFFLLLNNMIIKLYHINIFRKKNIVDFYEKLIDVAYKNKNKIIYPDTIENGIKFGWNVPIIT